MNYVTLFETIKGYVENDFPDVSFTNNGASGTITLSSTEQINTFIDQAEQRIFNSVQFPSLRKNVTGTTTTNNKYLACPDDFLATYSLAVVSGGEYTYLINKDVNFIRASYPSPTSTGLPAYYALFGPQSHNINELTFILGPTPDNNYEVELHYFFYPPSIVTAGTSWLGDNLDSVLLYGALVEAYTFMKGEPDMIAVYDGKYKEALGMAKRLGDAMERQDSYRSGQVRIPVT